MAKLSNTPFFLLALLVFTVVRMAPLADAECATVLSPDSCDLSACKQKCAEPYKGDGVCAVRSTDSVSYCVCYFNCGVKRLRKKPRRISGLRFRATSLRKLLAADLHSSSVVNAPLCFLFLYSSRALHQRAS
ncbi:hypothetical protein HHK36_017473 [Tetracentron sinense]|uniref:Uncharacterized protein n=1 Tax=Tetracentron sinense TaxID=13715 RepID=A0A834Z5E6_TETSI|nr:hypothetical protein HHK36_017473 [Tetracentron sinense]